MAGIPGIIKRKVLPLTLAATSFAAMFAARPAQAQFAAERDTVVITPRPDSPPNQQNSISQKYMLQAEALFAKDMNGHYKNPVANAAVKLYEDAARNGFANNPGLYKPFENYFDSQTPENKDIFILAFLPKFHSIVFNNNTYNSVDTYVSYKQYAKDDGEPSIVQDIIKHVLTLPSSSSAEMGKQKEVLSVIFHKPLPNQDVALVVKKPTGLGGVLSSARNASAQVQQTAVQRAQQELDNCVGGASCRDAEGDMLATKKDLNDAYMKGWNSVINAQKNSAPAQPQVDTDANRRLVGRIYTATTTAISKELAVHGVDAAKLLIQHPENSAALTAIVKRELHEGNLILAAYAMGDALSDANDYINNGRKGAMPTVISPQDMTDNINNVQKGRQNNQQYTSESKLLADASTNKSIGHFSSIAGGFIVRTMKNNNGTKISLAPVPQVVR